MIYRLNIRDVDRSCVGWWKNVDWLKDKTTIEFRPGLNILFGPNGTGKSTVLTLLARLFCCEQGGEQKITSQALRQVMYHPMKLGQETASYFQDGILPDHDGSPVMYVDPGNKVGIIGGGFDDDFFRAGLENSLYRGSAGQTTNQRIVGRLSQAMSKKWPKLEIPSHIDPNLRTFLTGTRPRERPTLLLDEPSRSLDIPTEALFWGNTPVNCEKKDFQCIAATHSPFALLLKNVHYIETKPGYIEHCVHYLKHLGGVAEAGVAPDLVFKEKRTPKKSS